MTTAPPARKTRKPLGTMKTVRYHLCDSVDFQFVALATRATYGAIERARLKQLASNPYCFIVSENVVIDPEARDFGTIYWYDENGGRIDWIVGI